MSGRRRSDGRPRVAESCPREAAHRRLLLGPVEFTAAGGRPWTPAFAERDNLARRRARSGDAAIRLTRDARSPPPPRRARARLRDRSRPASRRARPGCRAPPALRRGPGPRGPQTTPRAPRRSSDRPRRTDAMNGRPGESGLSATMATRSMSSGRPRSQKREADAVDRREIGSALGDRLHARLVRTGDDDCAEKRRAARDGSDRGAEQIHAGVAVVSVERGGRAAEFAQRAARVAGAADDEASMRGAFAAGKRIFRRRDQRHRLFEAGHIGIAAGLAEDELWVSPERGEVAAAGQPRRRLDARLGQPRGNRRPQRVIGRGGPWKIVHRQDRNRRLAAHAARWSQPG